MDAAEIHAWLTASDPARGEVLRAAADGVRRSTVGDAVHLRGLVEVSNHCRRHCTYCGIRGPRDIPRYRMTPDEVLECAREAVRRGHGTLVLQAGEDPALDRDGVATLVRRIKAETPLAVTLSLGERTPAELLAWRMAGADRYLLRFETSNSDLYHRIHPGVVGARRALLVVLRDLGYQVGTGFLVGLPGQKYADVVSDLLLLRDLEPDMVGLGPYLPHPDTPLAREARPDDEVPRDLATSLRVLALARLLCPRAHLPSTTALSTLDPGGGRGSGLAWGANVVMPNLTPTRYRARYEIYPAKAGLPGEDDPAALEAVLAAMGRPVATGPGHALRMVTQEGPCDTP